MPPDQGQVYRKDPVEDRLWLSKGVDLMSRRYISVYQRLKAEQCNVCSCHRNGHCKSCNYGGIRAQAVLDHAIILGVRKFLSQSCARFKNQKFCYYDETGCEYKDFCPNCQKDWHCFNPCVKQTSLRK